MALHWRSLLESAAKSLAYQEQPKVKAKEDIRVWCAAARFGHSATLYSPATFGMTSRVNRRSERSALSTGMLPGVKCSDTLSMPPTLSL